MKKWTYYVACFFDEFQSRMQYHTMKASKKGVPTPGPGGPVSPEELKILKDLERCGKPEDYLDSETLGQMRDVFLNGFGNRNPAEFARAAKLGAKMGKKWCVSVLILAITYAREEGPSLVRDATYENLLN